MPTLELAIAAAAMTAGAAVGAAALERVSRASLITSRNLASAQRVMDRVGYSAGGVGAAIVRGFGAFGVYRAIRFGIDAIGDFDKSLQTLRATMADDKTSKYFGALIEKALELGSTTQFGANQAMEAMVELSKAGYNTAQVLKTIGPTLELATVGELSLKEASELMVNSLNQFSLGADQAGRVVDVLTRSSLDATTDIRQLGDALRYAGPFASVAGVSLEEAAATLAILSNNSIKASMGGTNLRGMLASLIAPTKQGRLAIKSMSDAMKTEWNESIQAGSGTVQELGLQIKDLDVTTIGFVAALENLKKASPSPGQLKALFGRLNVSGSSTVVRYLELIKQQVIANQQAAGSADAYTNALNSSLPNVLKKLTAAFETLIIVTGTGGFLTALKAVIIAVTDGVRVLGGFRENIQGSIVVAERMATTMRALGYVLFTIFSVKLLSMIVGLTGSLINFFGTMRSIVMVLGGFGPVVGGVVAVLALAAIAVAILWDKVTGAGDEVMTFGDIFVETAKYIWERAQFLGKVFWQMLVAIWPDVVSAFHSAWNIVTAKFQEVAKGMTVDWDTFTEAMWNGFKWAVNSTITLTIMLGERMSNLFRNIANGFDAVVNFDWSQPILSIAKVIGFSTNLNVFDGFFDELQTRYHDYLGIAFQSGKDITKAWWQGLSADEQSEWKKFDPGPAFEEIKRRAIERYKSRGASTEDAKALQAELNKVNFASTIPPQLEGGTGGVDAQSMKAKDKIEEYVQKIEQEATVVLMLNDARDRSNQLRELEKIATEGQITDITMYVARVKKAQDEITQGNKIKEFATSIADAFGNAADSIADDFHKIGDAFKSLVNDLRKVAFSTFVTKPFKELATSGLSGIFKGLNLFGSANGNVFSQMRIMPHGAGGVVSSPTMFPMRGGIGTMAEKDPEAIMPLARGPSGRLGVEVHGGGRRTTVNQYITTPDANSFHRSRNQIMADMKRSGGM